MTRDERARFEKLLWNENADVNKKGKPSINILLTGLIKQYGEQVCNCKND